MEQKKLRSYTIDNTCNRIGQHQPVDIIRSTFTHNIDGNETMDH